ncbi:MAG: hypothetical protein J0M08_02265 [Bacteroidetes bacterium]|nr:hypothetical protein [Bacteroidota bacterium]
MKTLKLIAALILLISIQANSQNATPGITQEQKRQKHKISHGTATGKLTAREAKQLKADQRKIVAMKKVAKADGKVTKEERAVIRQEQKIANKRIHHEKHDKQQRK